MDDALFINIVDIISEGVYYVDLNQRITFWNRGAERITGFSRVEMLGENCGGNTICDHGGENASACPLAEVMRDGRTRENDIFFRHKDGHRIPVSLRSTPLRDARGAIVGAIEIFSDRSARGSLIAELERLKKEALTDPLTGLGNRRFVEMSLEARFEALAKDSVPFGVIMFDIDRFKSVNDLHGHEAGDRVLRAVADSISTSLRRLDAAARWGGEEFLVLSPNVSSEILGQIAERVRQSVLAERIELPGGDCLGVTVSGGGAIARPKEGPIELVARADLRLYQCKESGRNRSLVGD
ncbi:MAG TPA: sensor domain-containing diguanylate cyclase [Rectinemataceae bacterium]|nr:sensor domain-containing diguanylate cyclase [Rectinemataceae bacterium]